MHQNGVRRLGLLGSVLPHHQDMRLADQRDGKQTASLNVLGSFVVLSPNFFKLQTLFTGHRSTSTKAIGTHTLSTMPKRRSVLLQKRIGENESNVCSQPDQIHMKGQTCGKGRMKWVERSSKRDAC
jgi:hypothetical protein